MADNDDLDKAAAPSNKAEAPMDVEGASVQLQQKKNSIYEDAVGASLVALFTYLFVDLREMAEKGELDGDQEDIDKITVLPLRLSDLLKVFKSNIQNLEKKIGPDAKDLYLLTLEDLAETSKRSKRGELEASTVAEIVRFDDDYKNAECVYSISLNHVERRVIVSFRGSVSNKDWVIDVQANLREIPNPVYDDDDDDNQMETIGIHHGFQEYLYGEYEGLKDRGLPTKIIDEIKGTEQKVLRGKKKDPPARRRKEMRNKTQTILQHVAILLEQHPGYELETTGHSLGGALATVFACEAAASFDPRIPKPVVCVSIAAPKVGNLPFRLAVEKLERQGKLQILRVRNVGDIVPSILDIALNFHKQSFVNRSYKNCGVQLVLQKCRSGYKLYPKIRKKKHRCTYGFFCVLESMKRVKHCLFPVFVLSLSCLLCCTPGCAAANDHGCKEHMKRLERNKDALQEVYLDDIYKKYYPQEVEEDQDEHDDTAEIDSRVQGGVELVDVAKEESAQD